MTVFREYDVGPVDLEKLPTTRAEARNAGLNRYFTGIPCKHGHVAWRFVHGGCVECRRAAGRSRPITGRAEYNRRWRAENPDAWKASWKRSAERHRERVQARLAAWRAQNVEHEKAYRAQRYAENAERFRAERRAHYHANPEAMAEQHRRWCLKNPEKANARCIARRARKAAAEGNFTAEDVVEITKIQGGRCAECGHKRKLTADHIQPLARGGSNWRSNIQMLCRPCNSSKGAKDPIDFARRKGRLL